MNRLGSHAVKSVMIDTIIKDYSFGRSTLELGNISAATRNDLCNIRILPG